MKTVYKYPFEPVTDVEISLPHGAKPLHVEVQDNQPCLWALIDTEAPLETQRFRMVGTGHPIAQADKLEHVSTFMMHDGLLVFHFFKEIK